MATVTEDDVRQISAGFDPDPARSMSLRTDAYTDAKWAAADLEAIFGRTWQHGVHHFHGLVLDAYRSLVRAEQDGELDRPLSALGAPTA